MFIRDFKEGLYSQLYFDSIKESGYLSPESSINFEIINYPK